jgi:hypothetical protein
MHLSLVKHSRPQAYHGAEICQPDIDTHPNQDLLLLHQPGDALGGAQVLAA